MSNEMQQITPFDGYGSEIVEYGGGPRAGSGPVGAPAAPVAMDMSQGPQQGAMLKKVHNSLRGRYWIAVALGAVFGAAGGYFGFKSQQPIYRGEGLLQIAFNKPVVLQANDTSGPMMNFEEYVQSQAMMMTSRTIINKAMQGADWKATGLKDDAAAQSTIATNLTVEHPSRTELIRVYYTDKNPELACNVVKAIVKAYFQFSTSRNQTEDFSRLKKLEDRRAMLAGKVAQADSTILNLANEFGTPNLDALLENRLQEETAIQAKLNQAELALQLANNKRPAMEAVAALTENQIAMMDVVMRNMVVEREQVQSEIARLGAGGMMTGNVKMKQLNTLLEVQQTKIDKYAAEWRDLQMKLADDPTLGQGTIPRIMQMSPRVIAAEVETLKKKYEEVKEQRTKVGQQSLKIQDQQRQREDLAKERADVQRRIDTLNLERDFAGRLSVLSEGEVPIQPFKDRRKMFGAAGALGGFGLPLAFFVFLGLLDKRYRYSDEANDGVSNVPLLGILPRLPDRLSDPEQAAVAAHCIHQIRIMLQVGNNPEKRRVFMVTSASTGDGKTSLTMALGLSFAASGSKTLVVDCDMVGQGLTHRLKATNVPGLVETLSLGTLRGHVRKTATKGLYVLPIGGADAVHAGALSPASIKRLLAACREHFDIMVIDTGPILGSLEASVVAAEADGVIMAVARGQNQPLVEKAIKHLRAIGANIYGIVFNRAEARDFQRSVTSASIRSMSAKPLEQRHLLPDTDESARFGPLARSVASCLPASASNGTGNGNGNGNGHVHVHGGADGPA
jgi:capsular exopolysaccharide synthesis family protein